MKQGLFCAALVLVLIAGSASAECLTQNQIDTFRQMAEATNTSPDMVEDALLSMCNKYTKSETDIKINSTLSDIQDMTNQTNNTLTEVTAIRDSIHETAKAAVENHTDHIISEMEIVDAVNALKATVNTSLSMPEIEQRINQKTLEMEDRMDEIVNSFSNSFADKAEYDQFRSNISQEIDWLSSREIYSGPTNAWIEQPIYVILLTVILIGAYLFKDSLRRNIREITEKSRISRKPLRHTVFRGLNDEKESGADNKADIRRKGKASKQGKT